MAVSFFPAAALIAALLVCGSGPARGANKRPDSRCESAIRAVLDERQQMLGQLHLAVERNTIINLEYNVGIADVKKYSGRILKVDATNPNNILLHLEGGKIIPFSTVNTSEALRASHAGLANTIQIKAAVRPAAPPAIAIPPANAAGIYSEKRKIFLTKNRDNVVVDVFIESKDGKTTAQTCHVVEVDEPLGSVTLRQMDGTVINVPIIRVATRPVTPRPIQLEPLTPLGRDIEGTARTAYEPEAKLKFAMKVVSKDGLVHHGEVGAIHYNTEGRLMLRLRLISRFHSDDIFKITKFSTVKGKETYISLPFNDLKPYISEPLP